jgi:mannose-6-phosphate isomerase-like protein (cupin superfamily)
MASGKLGEDRRLDVSTMRRVVSGVDAEGRSTFVSDEVSPHFKSPTPFADHTEFWVTPSAPPRPDGEYVDTAAAAPGGLEPDDPHGTLCRVVTIHPDQPDFDVSQVMHATRTVDYCIVLSGEVVCVLESGEATLREGDVLIQRGTVHGWSNRTDAPCSLVCVQVGAFDHLQS